jgi:hypothetical protein
MGKCHGPEGIIFNLRPIEGGVDHHGSGFGDNDTNAAFGNPILPLGTDSTEANQLDIGSNFLNKLLTLKGSVVSVVGFNGHSMVEGHTFKAVLGSDSVRSIQSHLMFTVDETRGGVTEDH